MSWTPPVWLRQVDLFRKECLDDPAYGLPPAEKLERIALLMSWGMGLLREKAGWRGVGLDELLREQAAAAHRRALWARRA